MATSIVSTKTKRKINPREPYTPTKNEQEMKYKLDEKKTLEKKVIATQRSQHVNIELKSGTLVMTFTPAAYEIYKAEIFRYFDEHPHKTYTNHKKTSKTKQRNVDKVVTEESLSIKYKNGDKAQLYRINMFHTRSKMDVNGRLYELFMTEDLPELIRNVKMENVNEINKKIMDVCEMAIRNYEPPTSTNKKAVNTSNITSCISRVKNKSSDGIEHTKDEQTSLKRAIEHKTDEKRQYNDDEAIADSNITKSLCPACTAEVSDEEDSIECTKCQFWFHKTCTNLTEDQFKEQVENENNEFFCTSCKILDDSDIYINNNEQNVCMELCEMDTVDREGATDSQDSMNDIEILKTKNECIDLNVNNQQTLLKQQLITSTSNNQQNSNDDMNTTIEPPIEINPQRQNVLSEENEVELPKIKSRKNKKKETTDIEEQLSACRARIIILEERNKEYEKTIQMLQNSRNREPSVSTNNYSRQNIESHDVRLLMEQMQRLENTVTTKLELMNMEIQHKFQMQEMSMKYQLEINYLKNQINTSANETSEVHSKNQNGPTLMNVHAQRYGQNIPAQHPPPNSISPLMQGNPNARINQQQLQPHILLTRNVQPQVFPTYSQQAYNVQISHQQRMENQNANRPTMQATAPLNYVIKPQFKPPSYVNRQSQIERAQNETQSASKQINVKEQGTSATDYQPMFASQHKQQPPRRDKNNQQEPTLTSVKSDRPTTTENGTKSDNSETTRAKQIRPNTEEKDSSETRNNRHFLEHGRASTEHARKRKSL